MSSLSYTVCPEGVIVAGKTYDVREILKAVGGRWKPEVNGWVFRGEDEMDAVRERIMEALAEAAAVAKKIRNAELAAIRAKRVWEASPEGRRKRVDEALAAGTHTWICCKHCDVLDWTRKTSDCSVHGFRLRGCTWNGT